MTKKDFLGVSVEILKASCDQMDDVKAAFRFLSKPTICDSVFNVDPIKLAMTGVIWRLVLQK